MNNTKEPLLIRPKREIKRHLPKRFVEVTKQDIDQAITDCANYATLNEDDERWFYAWIALEASCKSRELNTAAYAPQWAFDWILLHIDSYEIDTYTDMVDTLNIVITVNYMRSRDLPNLEFNWAIQVYLLDICVEVDLLLQKNS